MRVLRSTIIVLAAVSLLAPMAPASATTKPGPGSVDSSGSVTGSGGVGGPIPLGTVPDPSKQPVCDPATGGSRTAAGGPRTYPPSELCSHANGGPLQAGDGGWGWYDEVVNCVSGFEVYRFYGTLADPAKQVTRSTVEIQNWCVDNTPITVNFPNPIDSKRYTADSLSVSRTAGEFYIYSKQDGAKDPNGFDPITNRVVYTTLSGVETSGDPLKGSGNCVDARTPKIYAGGQKPVKSEQNLAEWFYYGTPEQKRDIQNILLAQYKAAYDNYVQVVMADNGGYWDPIKLGKEADLAGRLLAGISFSNPQIKLNDPATIVALKPVTDYACSSLFEFTPVTVNNPTGAGAASEVGLVGTCIAVLGTPEPTVTNGHSVFADSPMLPEYNKGMSRMYYAGKPSTISRPTVAPGTPVRFLGSDMESTDPATPYAHKSLKSVYDTYLNAAATLRETGGSTGTSTSPLSAEAFKSNGVATADFWPTDAALTAEAQQVWTNALGVNMDMNNIKKTLKRSLKCTGAYLHISITDEDIPTACPDKRLNPKACCPGEKCPAQPAITPSLPTPSCESTGTCSSSCPSGSCGTTPGTDPNPGSSNPNPQSPNPTAVQVQMSVKADTVFHVGGVGEEQSVQLADPVLMCGAAKCTSNSGKSYPQQLDPQAVSWPPRMSLDVQSTSPTYYKECTYGSRERNCAFMEVPRSGTTPPERWTGVFFSPTNATQFVQPHAGVSVPIQDYKWQSREVWGWGNPYTKWENILPCPKKPRPCPQRLTVHRDWVFQYLAWDIVKSGQAYTVNRYYLVPDDNPLWPVVGSTGT